MTIISVLFVMAANTIEASIVYSFSQGPSGVQLDYSGNLDSSSLSSQGGLTAEGSFIDLFGIVLPAQQIYELENFRSSPLLPDFPGVSSRYSSANISFSWNLDTSTRHYNASSAYGETFGFYIFQQSGVYYTWMNLPFGYVSENPITGGMVFAGETLSSMGLSPTESFQVFLPGQQTISGAVVPEPSTLGATAAASVVLLMRRRRERRNPINK